MKKKLFALVTTLALAGLTGLAAAPASAGVPGLTYTGAVTAASGSPLGISATLNDAAGVPVSGATVSFTLANQPAITATTNTLGQAAASLRILKAAGTYDLKVSAGDKSVTVPFAVSAPATSLSLSTVASGGGEPSITVGPEGNIYVSSPSGPLFARSVDGGSTWIKPTPKAFSSSGDTTVSVDSSGAVYQSNLNGISANPNILQTDLFKSKTFGAGWVKGQGVAMTSNSSNQPFLTDRQWADAYIPPGTTTDQARVYLTYHDWGPNQIWVNTSTDGGAHFGPPIDVITSPLAEQASFCDTIPGGLQVVKSGPHAGRVYVAWLAGDIATNLATGCNITQLNTFHSVWIAWSDNADAQVPTWTNQLVFDGQPTHDGSALFADFTLDNAGNPYAIFSMNIGSEWDTYIEASFDNGATWNGKADGTGAPYKVNADTGTHYFPTIAVGAPGMVDVAYLRTDKLVQTSAWGKPNPTGGGLAGAQWKLYFAQTLDLNLGNPTWTITETTPSPMHVGDICVLGLFCAASGGDRSLLDFIDVAIDAAGHGHVTYVDNGDGSNATIVANQVAGPLAF